MPDAAFFHKLQILGKIRVKGEKMAETLRIMVSSDKHLDYVINLTRAAHEKGKEVQIFFTGKGVLLALKPGFEQLGARRNCRYVMSASELMVFTAVKRRSQVSGSKTSLPRQRTPKWWPRLTGIWFFKIGNNKNHNIKEVTWDEK